MYARYDQPEYQVTPTLLHPVSTSSFALKSHCVVALTFIISRLYPICRGPSSPRADAAASSTMPHATDRPGQARGRWRLCPFCRGLSNPRAGTAASSPTRYRSIDSICLKFPAKPSQKSFSKSVYWRISNFVFFIYFLVLNPHC